MLKFDKNLVAIHAYLCADGYVIRNPPGKSKYYYIGFRNTCDKLLSDFEEKFYDEFNVNPRRCKDGRTVVQRKKLYFYFTECFSYYSRDWVMPDFSRSNLSIWLRAFFDCEGWVLNKVAVNRHIGLDSVNHKGILQIRDALEKFGIRTKFKQKKGRSTYRILIYGKFNLIRFQKRIGFLHPDKAEKLQHAIDSYVDYNWKFSSRIDVLQFLRDRIKNRNLNRVRICSKYRKNVELLSKLLLKYFSIESKVYGPNYNGIGTKFYELCVQKKNEVDKLALIFT